MNEHQIRRFDIIQFYIDLIGAKSYLEIGVADGVTFNKIRCRRKVGVDPDPRIPVKHKMTSDAFFRRARRRPGFLKRKFDVIFIDGLHYADQVYRDVHNSLKHLNKGGVIICHDMNPWSEEVQRVPCPGLGILWTGDCWKAWVRLRQEGLPLRMFVINTDCGCGVIQRGPRQEPLRDVELTWESLVANRQRYLNLVSPEDWFLSEIPAVKPFTAAEREWVLNQVPFPLPRGNTRRVICPVLRAIYERSDEPTRELVLEAMWMAKRITNELYRLKKEKNGG